MGDRRRPRRHARGAVGEVIAKKVTITVRPGYAQMTWSTKIPLSEIILGAVVPSATLNGSGVYALFDANTCVYIGYADGETIASRLWKHVAKLLMWDVNGVAVPPLWRAFAGERAASGKPSLHGISVRFSPLKGDGVCERAEGYLLKSFAETFPDQEKPRLNHKRHNKRRCDYEIELPWEHRDS
jgi:hypothetical protein